ncbi:MAG: YIP1 family protein [Firmicutes bacterium]|nr:YIP1 family protein [Bacillota bacterium]
MDQTDREELGREPEAGAPGSGPIGAPAGGRTGLRDGGPAAAPAGPGPEPRRASSLTADFADFFSGIFIAPTRTLREVVHRPAPPLGAAVLAYLVAALIVDLSGAATWREAIRGFFEAFSAAGVWSGGVPDVGTGSLLAAAVLSGFILRLVLLVLKTGFLAVAAAMVGGRGDPARLFACLALTYLPALATVPVNLATGAQDSVALGLGAVVGLAVLTWRVVLDVIALRETLGLDTSKAVLVALAPAGLALAVFLILLLVWTSAFFWAVGLGLPGTLVVI